jgi:acetyl-CoA acetyltransferase
MSMMYIVGVGMTAFGRFLESSVKSSTPSAVCRALEHAVPGRAASGLALSHLG